MQDQPDDHWHEECGIVGIYGDERAAEQVYLGLYALQHRGQESAGIASADGSCLEHHKGLGLVWSVFADPAVMPKLTGHAAIGHNRYSTRGTTTLINAQPILIECRTGKIAVAHNGTITNASQLRKDMQDSGSIFQTTSDSEIVLHLIARSREGDVVSSVMDALKKLVGAYCFVFLTQDTLIAARDPLGFRPLSIGRHGDAFMVASETCAFDIMGAEYIRPVKPGEVVVIDKDGMRSLWLPESPRKSFCIFEHIYFSRPDSLIFGEKVDKIRRKLGKRLAEDSPADADIVISVPDSGNTAALGFARVSGLRYEIGLIRNHYVGRTFIAPHQDKRKLDVKVKLNPVSGVLDGKRVVLVDDSIVRGTTMRQIVRLLRDKGAREVHVRISSPPIMHPCYYGIDISKHSELIASEKSIEQIRAYLNADSLGYLTIPGMLSTVENPGDYCTACFSGDYSTPLPEQFDKYCI
ncbi:MAG TPA: amidophosphoribosyltransferase [Deltaproteobacteria bacterium]|nr:amidophosphoribosyltransferase [Deltaproteobacteria bacterium]HPR54501.1 amidophosphoribosyltransferase [Deltaproteobacteria bacterium]HXK46609.1 amidophosphoribosyltransferase [Deltaproteobacteria bacterium]